MKTVEEQVRRLQRQGSAQAIKARQRAARAQRDRLANQGPVTNANGISDGLLRQLDRRARTVAGSVASERPDLTQAIRNLRAEKGIDSPDDEATEYVPAPEDVLGELAETAEKTTVKHQVEQDCPDPESVLSEPDEDEPVCAERPTE